jgi:hypothetical protein
MEMTQEKTINFSEKFFTAVEGSYFRKSNETNEPVFVLNLGGEEIMLPFVGIRREFSIEEDSSDDKMLMLVAGGLDYVKVLMPGDDLPSELLTGEASWEISDDHRKIAQQRLSMQLVSWMSGDENLITDPQQLLQIADDPNVKEKINKAFEEAASAIGLESSEGNKVVDLIEELSEELAYIETLREQFRGVMSMQKKIKRLRNVAAKHRSILDSATSVSKLIAIAVNEFGEEFDMADGQTGEIIAVLKNVPGQKEYIRNTRDSVYRRLVAWDDLLRAWDLESGQYTATVPDLLRDTYRFLAPRYMVIDDWLLAAQVQNGEGEPAKEHVW